MIDFKGYDSGYLECNLPKLSTAAYVLTTFLSQQFNYRELSVIATFLSMMGNTMFLNSKEIEGCLPMSFKQDDQREKSPSTYLLKSSKDS